MMYPRTEYEMTEDDLKAILDACKPVPAMFLGGGTPMFGTPQENANAAWKRLGDKMGFDHMTVWPIGGKGQRFFTAIPNETEEARSERLAKEAIEDRKKEIARITDEILHLQARRAELMSE
jgi:hypothetical protein